MSRLIVTINGTSIAHLKLIPAHTNRHAMQISVRGKGISETDPEARRAKTFYHRNNFNHHPYWSLC
jgi:hypothetical protein